MWSWFKHDPSKDKIENAKKKGKAKQVDDDGQVDKDKRQIKHSKDHKKEEDVNPPPSWHCQKPRIMDQIPNSNSKEEFHKQAITSCYVCEKKFCRGDKLLAHPFWMERYCASHEDDGTTKCCSCERLASCGTKYVMLADDRWLCKDCIECAVMDTVECHYLHMEMRDFFESLNMKIDKEFPLLLVEKEALNEAEKKERIVNNYGMVTRGICLSEEQIVKIVTECRMGPNKQQIEDMDSKSQLVERKCEVTAILILHGLPRLLTGYILAHEMMHAWLRLNGFRNLNKVLEEGLCQVLAHMWLEPQRYATPDVDLSSSASSSSSSKKSGPSHFEKKFVEFCIYQIETDDSLDYGLGFKKVSMMRDSNHGKLMPTIKDIARVSKNTPDSKF